MTDTAPSDGARPLNIAVLDEPELVLAGVAGMLRRHPVADAPLRLVDPEGGPLPDLVLCDPTGRTTPPERYLAAVAARIAAPLVAFTWDSDPAVVRRVLAAGARAWLPKTVSSQQLVETLSTVASGHPRSALPALPAEQTVRLSGRERQVLELICRGHSNAEIAEELYVSVNSVKTYVRQIYQKTGVSRRAQAVAWGLAHRF